MNAASTPVRLVDVGVSGVEVYAKLESRGPTGSVKDRTARSMVDAAERDGRLTPGGIIVEASSGNTGIALAALGAERGYQVEVICSPRVTDEKIRLLELLGAIVHVLDTAELEDDHHYLQFGADLARRRGGVFLNQYDNPANPRVHEFETGPELLAQLDRAPDVFVAGAGTGGTISGIARALRTHRMSTRIVLADPIGSIYAHAHRTGELSEPEPYEVEAVGQAERLIPPNIALDLIDETLSIPDSESFEAARQAARQGILCGPSSGLALAAARRVALTLPAGSMVATLLPDGAERYLSRGSR